MLRPVPRANNPSTECRRQGQVDQTVWHRKWWRMYWVKMTPNTARSISRSVDGSGTEDEL